MEIINEYVAIGCGDGNVKFYDFSLRLEAWYEDVMAGPVTSLSFSLQESPFFQKEITGGPGLRFWAPDFIIGTSDAYIVGVASDCFHEIQAEDRRGTLLLQGMGDDVTAATCHPSMELLVIASFSGVLQLWDYSSKLLLLVRDFNDGGAEGLTRPKSAHSKNQSRTGNRLPLNKDHIFLRPLTLAFEPDSEFLVVGFSSGIVKFLNSRTLEDIASFAPSTALIRSLKFSYTGNYLGAYDSSNHVILFGRPTSEAGPLPDGTPTNAKRTSKFEYIGRYHSHSAEIVGIAFGESHDSTEVLISVSKDKRIVEYDCDRSSPSGGVRRFEDSKAEGNTKLDEPIRIELIAKPTAIMWLSPDFTDGSDDFVPENNFIVANDHFKFKEYIAKNKKCRKVVNSPTLGGYPTCLLPLPSGKRSSPSLGTDAILDSEDMDENTRNQNVDPVHPALPRGCRYYVYATEDHLIGIGCLPLSGNPDLVFRFIQ
jgi:WD40 repeat protein